MAENQGRERATEHQSEIVGVESDPGEQRPTEEHRDVASGHGEDRNELTPDQRGRTDGYGPRTHEDTKIDRVPPHE